MCRHCSAWCLLPIFKFPLLNLLFYSVHLHNCGVRNSSLDCTMASRSQHQVSSIKPPDQSITSEIHLTACTCGVDNILFENSRTSQHTFLVPFVCASWQPFQEYALLVAQCHKIDALTLSFELLRKRRTPLPATSLHIEYDQTISTNPQTCGRWHDTPS